MLKISEASHPDHRPMTLAAVAATMLDSLQPGPNAFPWVFDDIKKNKPVDIFCFRATLLGVAKARGYPRRLSIQSIKNERIVIIILAAE